MDKCPHCGDTSGVYRTYKTRQTYSWSGQPIWSGDVDSIDQKKYAYCSNCNRRVAIRKIGGSFATDPYVEVPTGNAP